MYWFVSMDGDDDDDDDDDDDNNDGADDADDGDTAFKTTALFIKCWFE